MSVCSSAQRVRFQLRRATNAQWESNNPILLAGEPGLASDTIQLKIGDGVTDWINLPYINVAGIAGADGTPTSLIPVARIVPATKLNKEINVTLPFAIVQNQGIIFTATKTDNTGGTIVEGTLYYALNSYSAESYPSIRTIKVKTTRTGNVAF
jgi:hypothetical protein